MGGYLAGEWVKGVVAVKGGEGRDVLICGKFGEGRGVGYLLTDCCCNIGHKLEASQ